MTYAVDLMQGIFAGDSLSLHGDGIIYFGSIDNNMYYYWNYFYTERKIGHIKVM